MNINLNAPEKCVFACVYGIAYGFFIGFSPIGRFFYIEYCYDMGSEDFLLGRMQLVMSICAALAFYALTSLTIKGWKGFLKTTAVSFLCFYLFSIIEIYHYIRHNPCFVPKYPDYITVQFFIWVLVISVAFTVFPSIIFMPVWLVSKFVLALLFAAKDDFLKLDLSAK
jgi:hypothetical protein